MWVVFITNSFVPEIKHKHKTEYASSTSQTSLLYWHEGIIYAVPLSRVYAQNISGGF